MKNIMIKAILFSMLIAVGGCEKDNDPTITSAIDKIEKEINAAHVTEVNTWNLHGTQQWSNWFATNSYAEGGFLIIPLDNGVRTFNLTTANLVEVKGTVVDLYY